jgi:hypothetical protein
MTLLIPACVLLLSIVQISQWLSNSTNIIGAFNMFKRSGTNIALDSYECSHNYTIEILSFDPWVLYINNFVKEEEFQHLLEIAQVLTEHIASSQANNLDLEKTNGSRATYIIRQVMAVTTSQKLIKNGDLRLPH